MTNEKDIIKAAKEIVLNWNAIRGENADHAIENVAAILRSTIKDTLATAHTGLYTVHNVDPYLTEQARISPAAPVVDNNEDRTRCASCKHQFCPACHDIDECCKCDTEIPPRTVAERLAQHEHIDIVEGVLGGVTPLVSRTRIGVHHILSYLYNGETIDYIAETYQLSAEAIKDAIAFAQDVYKDAVDLAFRVPTAATGAPVGDYGEEFDGEVSAGPAPTTAGQQQVFTRKEGDRLIYESKPPRKKFSDLTARMSPEAQDRMRARTEEMLRDIRAAAPVEQSAIDLDPLEFWCDLVEVLGHPRPVKVNPVSVIAEVEERLRQIPPTNEGAR